MMIVSLAVPAMAIGSIPSTSQKTSYPSEKTLAESGWSAKKGYTLQQGFSLVFNQHHHDEGINTNDPQKYLSMAVITRDDVLQNPNKYVKSSQKNIDKYTHKETQKFIMLSNTPPYTIYSFGGKYSTDFRFNHTHTEQDLAAMGFACISGRNLLEVLEYHFYRHCDDKGIAGKNITQYIDMALATREDTIKNPEKYKVYEQKPCPGYQPANKYVHKESGVFIILTLEENLIYSFGGKENRVRKKR